MRQRDKDVPGIDPPRREPTRRDPPVKKTPEKDPSPNEPPVKEPGKGDQEKIAAARSSLRFVRDGHIVGLGTGSTAAYAIQFLGERVRQGLKIIGIPTSKRSADLATTLAIPLATLDDYQHIDVTIDGADECDSELRLIKGGGGALLREKVVASASRQLVIITDSGKQVRVLGKFPLPVEVIPFAQAVVAERIAALGASVTLRQYAYGNPFITDEGHHILDCHFERISDPTVLALQLSQMPGVVEHGLFIGMADVVLVGRGEEVLELHSKGERRSPARSQA
jgi:ribose 5-phosphate isomerase A